MTTIEKVVLPGESADGFAHVKATRDSRLIRFYLWLYEANPRDINTCKLFWAIILAVPALVAKYSFKALDAVLPEQKPIDWDARELEAEARRQAGPSRMEQTLTAWTDRITAWYAKVAPVLRWAGLGLAILTAVFLSAAAIYLAITATGKFLVVLAYLAGILAVSGLVILLIERGERRSQAKGGLPLFKTLKRLAIGFHRHTCAKIDLN